MDPRLRLLQTVIECAALAIVVPLALRELLRAMGWRRRAREWEAVARNLAQVLEGENLDGIGALERQRDAHGLTRWWDRANKKALDRIEAKAR